MAARNRKKKQGCIEVEFLGSKKEDPWALVRKLEAQLAQEKFYHDKTKTEHQYDIKTLQAKVKNLERQKKTLLEKLEQNPIEQQNKLEKELNDISRQLRETTQKLVSSQQQVDKLLRANRGIKKAKDKMAEEFLNEIERKKVVIHKLETKIRDMKRSRKDVEAHNKTEPEENKDYWQPSDTKEMWDETGDDITQAHVEEEKGQTEDQRNMDASKTLEEKTQIEKCTVSFFPSMYDCNGNEGGKESSLYHKGFQNRPKNSETSFDAHLNEQLPPENQTINDKPNMEEETQDHGWFGQENNNQCNEAKDDFSDPEETYAYNPASKFKCWTKAKMDNYAKHSGNSRSACDCVNRLRSLYSRITVRPKPDDTEGITDSPGTRGVYKVGARPPPPGFNATETGPAVQAGFDFFNPPCFEPTGCSKCEVATKN